MIHYASKTPVVIEGSTFHQSKPQLRDVLRIDGTTSTVAEMLSVATALRGAGHRVYVRFETFDGEDCSQAPGEFGASYLVISVLAPAEEVT